MKKKTPCETINVCSTVLCCRVKQRRDFCFGCKRAALGETDEGKCLSFLKWIYWKLIPTSVLWFDFKVCLPSCLPRPLTKHCSSSLRPQELFGLFYASLDFAVFRSGCSLQREVAGSNSNPGVSLHKVCLFSMLPAWVFSRYSGSHSQPRGVRVLADWQVNCA